MAEDKDWLHGLKAVAEYTGAQDIRTLKGWIYKNKLPIAKVNGRWIASKSKITSWLWARTQEQAGVYEEMRRAEIEDNKKSPSM
jgi:hypothetical protein